ncbi:hypothetical protein IEO21_02882 [Rhodonia placenta]|uniref:Uncharacterized protein n=1 Tax=Rhodonia placenta TaxID=104341 RepID=A0A8H7U3Y3_9APHY|nr:hypothetical protein IEO21_02882 [Postia placenta]
MSQSGKPTERRIKSLSVSAEHRTEETDTAPLGQVFFRDPFKLDLERLHVWLPYSHNLSLSIQFGKWNDLDLRECLRKIRVDGLKHLTMGSFKPSQRDDDTLLAFEILARLDIEASDMQTITLRVMLEDNFHKLSGYPWASLHECLLLNMRQHPRLQVVIEVCIQDARARVCRRRWPILDVLRQRLKPLIDACKPLEIQNLTDAAHPEIGKFIFKASDVTYQPDALVLQPGLNFLVQKIRLD